MIAGALVLVSVGALLLYLAVDWHTNGCGCDESLYPGWSWMVLLGLAAASLVSGAMLLYRAGKAQG
jgi:hypothetical protein